jgi:hypothetical protein
MKKAFNYLLLVWCLGLMGVACSDDEDDKKGSTDTSVSQNDGTLNKKDGLSSDQKISDSKPSDGTKSGACTNAEDFAKLDTPAERDAVKEKAGVCGLNCLMEPDSASYAQCASPCIIKSTQLSENCTKCYVNILICTKDKCLLKCKDRTTAEGKKACDECQVAQGCIASFLTCSGLT